MSIESDLAAARAFVHVPGGWRPANNGAGERRYFVCRDRPADHPDRGRKGPIEYHTDKNGDLIRYTMGGAYRKATELNRGLT